MLYHRVFIMRRKPGECGRHLPEQNACGEPCINDAQCPQLGSCDEGKCACEEGYHEQDDKCVKGCEKGEVNVADECLKRVHISESCETMFSAREAQAVGWTCECPKGYEEVNETCTHEQETSSPSSSISGAIEFEYPSIKKNICCGKAGKHKSGESTVSPSQEVAEYGGTGTTSSPEIVCEKGIPYMVNGQPTTCTATVCPSNYRCVFSKLSEITTAAPRTTPVRLVF
uniref:EGF-like domain-containing protein n=1 Tax=Ditylenchus dipsaci TaxID=166011 RepID=A0A915CXZ4_9BILA